MPRIAGLCALLVGACSFDAPYGGGHYTCSDGVCPAGYTCSPAKQCVQGGTNDAAIDGRPAALTCSDPGPFPATGGMTSGTTASRSNTVSASCGGAVMNGPDAVYRIQLAGAKQLTVSLTASYAASAYVIAPCQLAPATPACQSDTAAAAGSPLVVSLGAGTYFIVLDGVNAAIGGTYTLTVAVQ